MLRARPCRHLPLKGLTHGHILAGRKTAAICGMSTAFHSLAPKGRGWGEGVTMIPVSHRRSPLVPPSPRRGEGVRGPASLTRRFNHPNHASHRSENVRELGFELGPQIMADIDHRRERAGELLVVG